MLRRSAILILALWASCSGLAPAGAEPVFPPGLRIGLEAPGDLKPSAQFPGFEDSERKVRIAILDLPGRAYQDIERSIFADEQRGLTDIRRESFPFANGVGFLITGVSTEDGVAVRHWFLLATGYGGVVSNLTTLINVSVPESESAAYPDAAIRKALTTVSFRSVPVEELLSLVPFKLGTLSGFRVVQVMREGAVALTDGPGNDIEKQPSMIVSIGPSGGADANSRALFARDMLTGSPFRELSLQSTEPMRINGLPGIEIKAQARAADGTPLSLVQWVRFGSGGFLRVLAVSTANDWTAQYPRFREIRDGIETR